MEGSRSARPRRPGRLCAVGLTFLDFLGRGPDGRTEYPGGVLFYGVVSAQTEKGVEFFLLWEAAEAMIGEVREDEPLLAEDLRVEAIEFLLS
jgi:hypothetical protein